MTNEQRQDNIDARLERLLTRSEQANARLDRMEALSEASQRQIDANASAIAKLSEATEANTAAIAELRTDMADLRSAVSSLVQVANQHQQNFEVIVGEIKGLRTESQRILEHLFGRQDS